MKERTRKLHLDFCKSMVDKDASFGKASYLWMRSNLTIWSDGRITLAEEAQRRLNRKSIANFIKHAAYVMLSLRTVFCCSEHGKFSFIENNMDQYRYKYLKKKT
ncbi:hypothetical protein AVEN_189360-1 [Araneus ventricosus]|uniref:Uncharacterized protein n=1 Tax=Araneus ventricosus TaxID=182803 RepID=A0A4Y2TRQ0_ARAVE|nr:hypothetical protein AVEN_189360-1 [Araneus ventricosus]